MRRGSRPWKQEGLARRAADAARISVREEFRPSAFDIRLELLRYAFALQVLTRYRHLHRLERRVRLVAIRKIVLQHRRAPEHDPVGARGEGGFGFLRRADLAGDAESRVVPLEFGEVAHQAAALVLGFLGLLEHIPQRQIQKIDLVFGHYALRDPDDLAEHDAEALRRQPHAQHEILAAAAAHAVDDLEQDARAVFERAAVFVVAVVEFRAEELAQDVAVRAVQLDAVEPGLFRAQRSRDEVRDQLLHLGVRQAARARLRVGGRAYRCATDQFRGSAHAGVMQLHDGDALLCLDRTRQAPQSRKVIVRPDAQLPGETFSDRLHVGGAGHRQTEAALRAHDEPAEFLFGQAAVFIALAICQGSQHEAVLHGRPVAETQRVQQMRHRESWGR